MSNYTELLLVLSRIFIKNTYDIKQDDQEIIHTLFKQQGAQEVIDLIQGLQDGTISAKDFLSN